MPDNNNTENNQVITRPVLFISIFLCILNLIVGAVVYPQLPEKVPTHWNFAGEVDGWGSPFQGAFLIPLIMIGALALLYFLPKIDPKRENYIKMGKAYSGIALVMMLFFTVLQFGSLGSILGYFNISNVPKVIMLGVGVLIAVIGKYMGGLKHNYFAGIKTPWTLANEEVWRRTHRMAGPIWVVGGILIAVIGFIPAQYKLGLFIAVMLVLTLIPVAYSYIIFKKLEGEK
ncbi:MAG: SdpI family protein [Peptococcaceae bacterium]|nr:SdpI family protein [Peptococcaceae bacterium]